MNKMTVNNKSSVPNTHLMSMPLTPGYSGAGGPTNSHISYFDDEDDDEDDDEYADFEGDDYQQARSRSNSISAQLHHARSKVGLNDGSGPVNGNNSNRTSPHMHATTAPGMTLAPLPRMSSSTTTTNNPTNILIDHGLYPASPPSSKPSSPTTPRILSSSSSTSTSSSSVHTPNTSNKTSPLWQRQSHEDGYDINAPKGRSFSQSAATSYYSSVPPQQQQAMTPRIRSQSSPNIHKNAPHQWDDLPQVPINSRTYYQQQQQPAVDTIKIKLSYNNGIYVIVCSMAIGFSELMDKVEKKIKLVSNLQPNDVLRLKYQDEDEDFITVNSDDDVQMAFESRGSNTVNLFVSH